MKRKNVFKIGLSIAIAMFVTTVFGQVINGDYKAISGDQATAIDSVTVNTTTKLYVKPDPYYHPNYVGPGWALTANFTWTWTVPPAGGTPVAEVITDNVVDIDWTGAPSSLHNIIVTETAPLSLGGCSDDTNMYVRIVAEPTVTYTAGAGYISADLTVCEGDAQLADDLEATFTGIRTFQLDWSLEIATLDGGGSKDEYFDTSYVSLGAGPAYAIDHDGAAGGQELDINATTYTLAKPSGGLKAIGGSGSKKSTVYTYSIDGVNDRISRKSGYEANPTALNAGWTWYDTTSEVVVVQVNPAPVTGPIYHVPNDWDQ